jgi:hypothetical protein
MLEFCEHIIRKESKWEYICFVRKFRFFQNFWCSILVRFLVIIEWLTIYTSLHYLCILIFVYQDVLRINIFMNEALFMHTS